MDERPTRERAYEYIQRKILRGDLQAGSAVSELALARDFGSSRTPIREAIGQLIAEGFLETVANRGTVVVQFDRSDIIELYELREALETYAVRKLAVTGLKNAEVARLREIIDVPITLGKQLQSSEKEALDEEGMQQFIAADMAFHTLLIHAAGNRRILKIVNDTRLLIRIFSIRRGGHTAEQLTEIHRKHTRILDALLRGAGDEAARLVAEHIRGSLQERLDAYDSWERECSLRRTLA
jgi:DNA-binding GntR family transcriptional regulator